MEEPSRIAPQRRYIERRAEELLERIPFMDDAELRWTVRVLQDCLPPAAQEQMLLQYSEHLELHQMRHVVQGFVSRYTEHALQALEAKRFTPGTGLKDFTDEELQSMSAAEKCGLLQGTDSALHPYQLRRELARLFMCLDFNLFHDPGLGEASVEFNAYLDVLERLQRLPDTAIEELKEQVLAALSGVDYRDASAVDVVLTTLREAIGRGVGLVPPFDHLFRERMARWPPTPPPELPEVLNPEITQAIGGMNLSQLQSSLRVLLELMGLEEQRREFEPIRSRYRSLGEIPVEALTAFLPRLSMRLGDRNICDFALRYRSGRLWARDPINPEAWKLLPFKDRFMVLEADNEAMDSLQAARHLSRLLLTERYELLFDPAYQVGLTYQPIYQRVLDRCMRELRNADDLQNLNRQVTRMMLELEEMVPDVERPGRFLAIREVIGTGLRFAPAPDEG
jgi:hypothetical protein